MSVRSKTYKSLVTTAFLYISVAFFTQAFSNCGLFNASSTEPEKTEPAAEVVADAGTVDMSKVASPVLSPVEGIIPAGTEIEMSCETPESYIYYWFLDANGQMLDTEMTLYDPQAPPKLQSSMTIQAVAVKTDMPDSDLVTVKYTVQ
jgi:hypothetical protein